MRLGCRERLGEDLDWPSRNLMKEGPKRVAGSQAPFPKSGANQGAIPKVTFSPVEP